MNKLTILKLTGNAVLCSSLLPIRVSKNTSYYFRHDVTLYITRQVLYTILADALIPAGTRSVLLKRKQWLQHLIKA